VRSFLVTFLTLTMSLGAQGELIRGELLNDDDPYFVRAGGAVYKVQWYGGSSLFYEGDDVLLTTRYGLGKMISDANDETADVWIEQIDENSANFSESIRDAITKSPVATPAPSVSAATPTPRPPSDPRPNGALTHGPKALAHQEATSCPIVAVSDKDFNFVAPG
jgi:hypothetical protein